MTPERRDRHMDTRARGDRLSGATATGEKQLLKMKNLCRADAVRAEINMYPNFHSRTLLIKLCL